MKDILYYFQGDNMKEGDLVRIYFREYQRTGLIIRVIEKRESMLPEWLTHGQQTYLVFCVSLKDKPHGGHFEVRKEDLVLLSEAK